MPALRAREDVPKGMSTGVVPRIASVRPRTAGVFYFLPPSLRDTSLKREAWKNDARIKESFGNEEDDFRRAAQHVAELL